MSRVIFNPWQLINFAQKLSRFVLRYGHLTIYLEIKLYFNRYLKTGFPKKDNLINLPYLHKVYSHLYSVLSKRTEIYDYVSLQWELMN